MSRRFRPTLSQTEELERRVAALEDRLSEQHAELSKARRQTQYMREQFHGLLCILSGYHSHGTLHEFCESDYYHRLLVEYVSGDVSQDIENEIKLDYERNPRLGEAI